MSKRDDFAVLQLARAALYDARKSVESLRTNDAEWQQKSPSVRKAYLALLLGELDRAEICVASVANGSVLTAADFYYCTEGDR